MVMPLVMHECALQDHGYRASALYNVSVYMPAFALCLLMEE